MIQSVGAGRGWRVAARHAGVLVAATAVLLAAGAGSASADVTASATFTSPGSYTFTVPAGVRRFRRWWWRCVRAGNRIPHAEL